MYKNFYTTSPGALRPGDHFACIVVGRVMADGSIQLYRAEYRGNTDSDASEMNGGALYAPQEAAVLKALFPAFANHDEDDEDGTD